jgi:hypothetical protein
VAPLRQKWRPPLTAAAGAKRGSRVESRSSIRSVQESLTTTRRCASSFIEARFRDEIRGRVLATEEVLEAARRARERGVTVQILDDRRQDLEPRTLAAVSEDVASIDGAQTGTVTARARPQGGSLAVTIYASSAEMPDEPTLLEFPER